MDKKNNSIYSIIFGYLHQVRHSAINKIDRLHNSSGNAFKRVVRIHSRPMNIIQLLSDNGTIQVIFQVFKERRVIIVPQIDPQDPLFFVKTENRPAIRRQTVSTFFKLVAPTSSPK